MDSLRSCHDITHLSTGLELDTTECDLGGRERGLEKAAAGGGGSTASLGGSRACWPCLRRKEARLFSRMAATELWLDGGADLQPRADEPAGAAWDDESTLSPGQLSRTLHRSPKCQNLRRPWALLCWSSSSSIWSSSSSSYPTATTEPGDMADSDDTSDSEVCHARRVTMMPTKPSVIVLGDAAPATAPGPSWVPLAWPDQQSYLQAIPRRRTWSGCPVRARDSSSSMLAVYLARFRRRADMTPPPPLPPSC